MPASAQRKPRQRAPHLGPDRRRPQLLDAALAIAARSGIGAVTIGTVAAEIDVTRPVVYSCFADRIDMVETLLDREVPRLEGLILAALRSTAGVTDPEQAFIDGFRALLEVVTESPDAWRLVFSREPDSEVAERFLAARDHVTVHATSWIAPAMRQWWHTADLDRKLPVLIELFLASCESAVRLVLDESSNWEPDELGKFVGQAMYRAFKDA